MRGAGGRVVFEEGGCVKCNTGGHDLGDGPFFLDGDEGALCESCGVARYAAFLVLRPLAGAMA